ncbi:Uncharacterised protein [Vibrio cholerae]|nr:Uncharacterised protein [Vibrio cholerae]
MLEKRHKLTVPTYPIIGPRNVGYIAVNSLANSPRKLSSMSPNKGV